MKNWDSQFVVGSGDQGLTAAQTYSWGPPRGPPGSRPVEHVYGNVKLHRQQFLKMIHKFSSYLW